MRKRIDAPSALVFALLVTLIWSAPNYGPVRCLVARPPRGQGGSDGGAEVRVENARCRRFTSVSDDSFCTIGG
jgi:hypothetical protein